MFNYFYKSFFYFFPKYHLPFKKFHTFIIRLLNWFEYKRFRGWFAVDHSDSSHLIRTPLNKYGFYSPKLVNLKPKFSEISYVMSEKQQDGIFDTNVNYSLIDPFNFFNSVSYHLYLLDYTGTTNFKAFYSTYEYYRGQPYRYGIKKDMKFTHDVPYPSPKVFNPPALPSSFSVGTFFFFLIVCFPLIFTFEIFMLLFLQCAVGLLSGKSFFFNFFNILFLRSYNFINESFFIYRKYFYRIFFSFRDFALYFFNLSFLFHINIGLIFELFFRFFFPKYFYYPFFLLPGYILPKIYQPIVVFFLRLYVVSFSFVSNWTKRIKIYRTYRRKRAQLVSYIRFLKCWMMFVWVKQFSRRFFTKLFKYLFYIPFSYLVVVYRFTIHYGLRKWFIWLSKRLYIFSSFFYLLYSSILLGSFTFIWFVFYIYSYYDKSEFFHVIFLIFEPIRQIIFIYFDRSLFTALPVFIFVFGCLFAFTFSFIFYPPFISLFRYKSAKEQDTAEKWGFYLFAKIQYVLGYGHKVPYQQFFIGPYEFIVPQGRLLSNTESDRRFKIYKRAYLEILYSHKLYKSFSLESAPERRSRLAQNQFVFSNGVYYNLYDSLDRFKPFYGSIHYSFRSASDIYNSSSSSFLDNSFFGSFIDRYRRFRYLHSFTKLFNTDLRFPYFSSFYKIGSEKLLDLHFKSYLVNTFPNFDLTLKYRLDPKSFNSSSLGFSSAFKTGYHPFLISLVLLSRYPGFPNHFLYNNFPFFPFVLNSSYKSFSSFYFRLSRKLSLLPFHFAKSNFPTLPIKTVNLFVLVIFPSAFRYIQSRESVPRDVFFSIRKIERNSKRIKLSKMKHFDSKNIPARTKSYLGSFIQVIRPRIATKVSLSFLYFCFWFFMMIFHTDEEVYLEDFPPHITYNLNPTVFLDFGPDFFFMNTKYLISWWWFS